MALIVESAGGIASTGMFNGKVHGDGQPQTVFSLLLTHHTPHATRHAPHATHHALHRTLTLTYLPRSWRPWRAGPAHARPRADGHPRALPGHPRLAARRAEDHRPLQRRARLVSDPHGHSSSSGSGGGSDQRPPRRTPPPLLLLLLCMATPSVHAVVLPDAVGGRTRFMDPAMPPGCWATPFSWRMSTAAATVFHAHAIWPRREDHPLPSLEVARDGASNGAARTHMAHT
jgi:hypothetical protein